MAGNLFISNSNMNNSSQYILFVKKLLMLVLILFATDRLIGMLLEKTFYQQKRGDAQNTIHLVEEANEDLIIMGSSRASHHYRSDILEKETGLTTFNGGRDEMVITYIYATLDLSFQRHKPKVLILDVTPHELSEDKTTALVNQRVSTNLIPFLYKYPRLAAVVDLSDNHELLKAKVSHIYPYNSLMGTILQNTYTSIGHSSQQGYEPLIGTLDSNISKSPQWGEDYPEQRPISETYEDYLLKTVQLAKASNVKVVAILSPFYFQLPIDGNNSYKRMKQIFAREQIPFYDYSQNPVFLKNPLLFRDDVHLNDSGATVFSREIATIVKNHL